MEFSLLQMTAAKLGPQPSTDCLVHHIAALQRKEGDWPNYGGVRPPLEGGGFSHTAKGIRVLRLYPIAGRQAEFDDRVERAAKWLEAGEPRTTEDRSMQLRITGPATNLRRSGSNNSSRSNAPTVAGARKIISPRKHILQVRRCGLSMNPVWRLPIPHTAAASTSC
jgi:hypothetical protein